MGEPLKMEPTTAKTVANSIIQQKEELKSLLSQIRGYCEELPTYWEGEDATKYLNDMDQQVKSMDRLAETIESTANFMIEMSNKIEAREAEHASLINY